MLDRQIRLPGPQSQKTADVPAARIAWVEGKRAIDQRYHRIDFFAKRSERHCGIGQNAGDVLCQLYGPAAEIDPLLSDRIPIRSGSVADQLHAAVRRKGESGAVLRVPGNGLF